MSEVNININEAVVTAINEFKSVKGYGVDFFIEAQSSNGVVYLQVVCYDNEARSYCRYIHEGDCVRVTGDLKTKPYKKKDGTDALSLIIERPIVFSKMASGNSRPQLQQAESSSETLPAEEQNQGSNAVTAYDASFYEQFKDLSDVDPFDYEPEVLEKILKHIEEYKARTASAEADTAPQEPYAETAWQYMQEGSQYEGLTRTTQYRLPIPEDELPF